MFSLNGTLKKVGWLGNGKRNYLLGWPIMEKTLTCCLFMVKTIISDVQKQDLKLSQPFKEILHVNLLLKDQFYKLVSFIIYSSVTFQYYHDINR